MDHGLEVNAKYQQQSSVYHDAPQLHYQQEGLEVAPVQSRHNKDAPWKDVDQPRRKILGLPVPYFWATVVILVLLLAGAIGGGVGAGLAAQKKTQTTSGPQTSSDVIASATQTSQASSTSVPSTILSTSSTTSATTSAATSGPSPVIKTPCTNSSAANNTVLTAQDATGASTSSFRLLCNTNYPAGSAYGNPDVVDMFRVYTTDMQGCIAQCVAWNNGYAVTGLGGPKCLVVAVVKAVGEFCYLKTATGKNNTSTSGGAMIDSAVLIQ